MESVKNTQTYKGVIDKKGRINLSNSIGDGIDQRRNHSIDINKRIENSKKSDEVAKFIIYKGEGDASHNFNFEALLDYRIDYRLDKRISKYQEQMADLQNRYSNLLKNHGLAIPKKQEIGEIGIEAPNFDKAKDAITNMEDNDDIRYQIQCVTRVIKQIDILRKTSIFDENKRKLMAFLRTVMKINCDRKIFSEEQLREFKNVILLLQDKDVESDNLIIIEKRLRKSGLRTMISWE